MTPEPPDVPRSIGAAAVALTTTRGHPDRLTRVLERSSVPMLMVDDERRYVEVNRPARLLFRMSLAEFRRRRVDDLTPASLAHQLEEAWARLLGGGVVAGSYEVTVPDGGRFAVVFYALANALPGMHVGAFAPAGWSAAELGASHSADPVPVTHLTPRELEIVQMAALGRTGPGIADDLALSPATVRSHFENIYAKLGVPDRAAAVAKAMRLGLID
jgi:DNA-binding CsgD family transcriptional regulator